MQILDTTRYNYFSIKVKETKKETSLKPKGPAAVSKQRQICYVLEITEKISLILDVILSLI